MFVPTDAAITANDSFPGRLPERISPWWGSVGNSLNTPACVAKTRKNVSPLKKEKKKQQLNLQSAASQSISFLFPCQAGEEKTSLKILPWNSRRWTSIYKQQLSDCLNYRHTSNSPVTLIFQECVMALYVGLFSAQSTAEKTYPRVPTPTVVRLKCRHALELPSFHAPSPFPLPAR